MATPGCRIGLVPEFHVTPYAWSMASAVLLMFLTRRWCPRHVLAFGLCAVVAAGAVESDPSPAAAVASYINLTEADVDGESSDVDSLRARRVTLAAPPLAPAATMPPACPVDHRVATLSFTRDRAPPASA
jgi:hypothetical protein